MMKKLIVLAWVISMLFSCAKKTDFEGQRPDERLSEMLIEYENLLSGAEYGWKAHLFTRGGGGFGFLFQFDDKNRVKMLADITETTGAQLFESSYRLKAALQPSIYFDTYSYLHQLADPDSSVIGGKPGWGLFSDFEFAIKEVKKDTVTLIGSMHGSRMTLVRATREEAAAYESGNLNVLKSTTSNYFANKKFCYIEDVGGDLFSTNFNLKSKTLSIVFDKGGKITSETFGFSFFGLNEIVMSGTFRYGKLAFNKLIVDTKKNELMVAYGNSTLPIWDTHKPLFPFEKMWGMSYESILVPMEMSSAGNGAEFDSRRNEFLTTMRGLLAPGTTFPIMGLTLDRGQKLLFINQVISQGGRVFNSKFVLSYKETVKGYVFKYEGAVDANARLLEEAFIPVLEGFIYGPMRFEYDVQLSALRASGESDELVGFKFVGEL